MRERRDRAGGKTGEKKHRDNREAESKRKLQRGKVMGKEMDRAIRRDKEGGEGNGERPRECPAQREFECVCVCVCASV